MPTSPSEPHWLPIEVVVQINRLLVGLTGEPHLLARPELLESALARPRNKFGYGEEDVVSLAVSLLVGIGRNHAFAQGNKRTAFIAAVDFLGVNGFALQVGDSEDLGRMIEAVLLGELSERYLLERWKSHIVPR